MSEIVTRWVAGIKRNGDPYVIEFQGELKQGTLWVDLENGDKLASVGYIASFMDGDSLPKTREEAIEFTVKHCEQRHDKLCEEIAHNKRDIETLKAL